MLFKSENGILLCALILVLIHNNESGPINRIQLRVNNNGQKTSENHPREIIIPDPDSSNFPDSSHFPNVNTQHDPEVAEDETRPSKRKSNLRNDHLIIDENTNNDHIHGSKSYKKGDQSRDDDDYQKAGAKPRMYKAVERVYYYPRNEKNTDAYKNQEQLDLMKAYDPEHYNIPYDHHAGLSDVQYDSYGRYHDPTNDRHDKSGDDSHESDDRKEHPQNDDDNPDDNSDDNQEDDSTQRSIADDVKEFGREAVDEADRFEKFLDNLKSFASDGDEEYEKDKGQSENNNEQKPNYDGSNDDTGSGGYHDAPQEGPSTDDRSQEYQYPSSYGHDDYDSEKESYQREKDKTNRGGHRYHKDRRRPKISMNDEGDEQRRHEVAKLIDSEPEEGDYLSNSDVVDQLKKSEHKYNTGVDPVYSSQRDFDEVKRLEKMIEKVAHQNKEKEKESSDSHDQHEGSETIQKVKKQKQNNKIKSDENKQKQ